MHAKIKILKISSFIVDETEDNEPSELSIECKYNYADIFPYS